MMPKRKSATDIKIDFLVKEAKETRTKIEAIEKQIAFGRGAVWILIFLGSIVASVYNLFVVKH